jgi:MFS family permease
MFTVLQNSWALLLGMLLLMFGNGLQGTLLGVRGSIEGFSASEMSFIMSGYFVGFLFGSRSAPEMIRRVGHVRVFAALASLVSACLILYAVWPNIYFWFLLRVVIGFCFSGVYVVAESWLNDAATNENRGKTLSVYLIVQMMGIVLAQWILNFADPAGYTLFIVVSVAVSISFAPILLSVSPAPMFQTAKPMKLKTLFEVSPLGVVGSFLLGAIFAALFGMAPIYGTEKGMSVGEISIFVAMIYTGGMLCQYPIGWLSDRMERRLLIIYLTAGCAVVIALSFSFVGNFYILLALAFVIGGTSNPLYSLFIAYTNDFLEHDDMASASAGLILMTGLGAIFSPLIVGFTMDQLGPEGFFHYIMALMLIMALFASYRSTQRSAPSVEDTSAYTPVGPSSSPVWVEVAQEVAIEMALEEEAEEQADNEDADKSK